MNDGFMTQQNMANMANGTQAAEMQKALVQVGYPNMGGGGGNVLVRQSLDQVLTITTLSMRDIKFWRMLQKVKALSPVEQYTELSSYGTNVDSGWLAEVDVPISSDAAYLPRYETLKYIGVGCGVSFVAMQTQAALFDLANEATRTGTMDLLRRVEHALWYGDSEKNPLQWDGIISKIKKRANPQNIFDMRGQPLDQDTLSNAANIVADSPNYGNLTHFFMNTKVKGDIARGLQPIERIALPMPGLGNPNQVAIGVNPTAFQSTSGMISFEDTPFLGGAQALPLSATGAVTLVPAAPVVTTAPAAGAPAAGLSSKFTQTDAGAYYYSVVACNNSGASAPTQLNPNAALTISANQAVTFTVSPGSGPAVSYYRVFRTPINKPLSNQFFIQDVPNISAQTGVPNGTPVTITDLNAKLPGTYDAVGLQFDPETIRFLQLGSLIRVPKAVVSTAMEWMLLLMGTPSLRAPNRCVLIQNVGLAPQPTPVP